MNAGAARPPEPAQGRQRNPSDVAVAAGTAGHHTEDTGNNQATDDGEDPGPEVKESLHAGAEQGAADPAADDGAHDAEDQAGDPASSDTSGHDSLHDRTNNEAKNNPRNDSHNCSFQRQHRSGRSLLNSSLPRTCTLAVPACRDRPCLFVDRLLSGAASGAPARA